MSYQSLGEKYSLLAKLIDIAKTDEVVNIPEISYIFWTQQQLQITDQELKNIFEKGARHVSPIMLRDRVEMFHKCITIMCVDNHISEVELAKCRTIANDLRLPLRQTEELFSKILENKGILISVEEVCVFYGVNF